jgi:hypothetical protein
VEGGGAVSESQIEKAVCAFAKAHGVSAIKLSGANDRGKADRMFMRDGKVIFIEFKAAGKRPTALQERFLRLRQEDGFIALWVDCADHAIDSIKRHLL